jgi:hypothetical protein
VSVQVGVGRCTLLSYSFMENRVLASSIVNYFYYNLWSPDPNTFIVLQVSFKSVCICVSDQRSIFDLTIFVSYLQGERDGDGFCTGTGKFVTTAAFASVSN